MASERHAFLTLATAAMLIFSLTPLILISIFSINESRFYAFPITGLTLQWYRDLLADERIWSSLLSSLLIAAGVSVISTCMGTAFAFVVVRSAGRYWRTISAIGFIPLAVPVLVLAAALQVAFVELGLPLGYGTVIIGHTIFATPFVVLMVVAQLYRYDQRLDAAARDLGASPIETFRYVTLPILMPSIRSGAILAFLLSFNEWAIAFFTGRGFNTLPMLVYSMQRNGLPPSVLAYSSLIVIFVLATVLLLLPFVLRMLRRD
ncbi:ABC transporter permease [Aestuariivirga sp.]|uniref:ABC transporter permease n=1 Tax=Aestuariivirga sp. TaxID=2650926 RepID=UPI00391D876F